MLFCWLPSSLPLCSSPAPASDPGDRCLAAKEAAPHRPLPPPGARPGHDALDSLPNNTSRAPPWAPLPLAATRLSAPSVGCPSHPQSHSRVDPGSLWVESREPARLTHPKKDLNPASLQEPRTLLALVPGKAPHPAIPHPRADPGLNSPRSSVRALNDPRTPVRTSPGPA